MSLLSQKPDTLNQTDLKKIRQISLNPGKNTIISIEQYLNSLYQGKGISINRGSRRNFLDGSINPLSEKSLCIDEFPFEFSEHSVPLMVEEKIIVL